jgi:3'-phosphoadenosine 5'-phosphosulfate sulfotransferase (PAPS reductase)/FAD synthetase
MNDESAPPANIRDLRIVASVSGGKDSTAMVLHLMERGLDFEQIFMDTGWEHPATVEYVTEQIPKITGRPVTVLRNEKAFPNGPNEGPLTLDSGGFVSRTLRYGMFPSRVRRWCTHELKIVPYQNYCSEIFVEDGQKPVNTIGIRAAESAKRAKQPAWEEADEAFVWRPLLRWTEQDVIEIHRKHNVVPNRLYLKGASRVGCWPCIHSRKAEIAQVAKTDPDRIAFIRALEQQAWENKKAMSLKRGAKYRGQSPASTGQPLKKPTFFQVRPNAGNDAEGLPIDEAVRWARTSHGGRQLQLIEAEPESGCMRWGLCDHPELND